MKYILATFLLTGIGLLFILVGCSESDKDEKEIIVEWIGKELKMPIIVTGSDNLEISNVDYKVFVFIDSLSCSTCRMRLDKWNVFMSELESMFPNKDISFLMVVDTKKKRDIRHAIKSSDFYYPVIVDEKSDFNRLNKFPNNPIYQVFLLDHNNKVTVIGDPFVNKRIKNLYLNIIGENDLENLNDFNEVDRRICNLGLISPNQRVSRVLNYTNESDSLLCIEQISSSCNCVSTKVSQKSIHPGESYSVQINFRDTIKGDFYREVELKYSNGKKSYIEIKGIIK